MTNRMLRTALWNTGGKSVAILVGKLAHFHDCDLIVLLEAGESKADVLQALALATGRPWFYIWTACERVTMLSSFSDVFFTAVRESARFSVQRLRLPGLPDLIIGAAHLRSQLHQRAGSQALGIRALVDAIENAESTYGHRRTVVFGDFNMDPFDDGMVGAGAMHGMMSRATARRGYRTVDSLPHHMFYNPMWGLLGDRSGPPGTYRYWSAEHICREWHIFDQVLIRPDLLDDFPLERLGVLDRIDRTPLLTKGGVPTPSDHLPLVFDINEPGGAHGI